MASAALIEPQGADFVAGTALCEPRCEDLREEVVNERSRRGGDLLHGGTPPDEQNQLLQDQIQCTIPTPDCNAFSLKQGELR